MQLRTTKTPQRLLLMLYCFLYLFFNWIQFIIKLYWKVFVFVFSYCWERDNAMPIQELWHFWSLVQYNDLFLTSSQRQSLFLMRALILPHLKIDQAIHSGKYLPPTALIFPSCPFVWADMLILWQEKRCCNPPALWVLFYRHQAFIADW